MKKTYSILSLTLAFCSVYLRRDDTRTLDGYVDVNYLHAGYGNSEFHLTIGPGLLWLPRLAGAGDKDFCMIEVYI